MYIGEDDGQHTSMPTPASTFSLIRDKGIQKPKNGAGALDHGAATSPPTPTPTSLTGCTRRRRPLVPQDVFDAADLTRVRATDKDMSCTSQPMAQDLLTSSSHSHTLLDVSHRQKLLPCQTNQGTRATVEDPLIYDLSLSASPRHINRRLQPSEGHPTGHRPSPDHTHQHLR
ncbi:hypothetical protein C0Q70_09943 [Pomacea canaliculata]|uniref:Uncharacterized protein n=1 Tax=Pomacea canaliculata TaxID=400727 RepID=A0A2T7PB73_POMCA|nr:hypothetical protein C0Q70_09943 [Pomacea canaliculata]